MFNRPYVLTVVSAEVSERTAEGGAWDPMGGAPDPFAVVFLDDVEVGRTAAGDDYRFAEWYYEVEITLFQSSKLVVYVYDADLDEPGYVGGFEYNLETFIKGGGSTASTDDGQLVDLRVDIVPK